MGLILYQTSFDWSLCLNVGLDLNTANCKFDPFDVHRLLHEIYKNPSHHYEPIYNENASILIHQVMTKFIPNIPYSIMIDMLLGVHNDNKLM